MTLHEQLDQMAEQAMSATKEWADIWRDGLNYVFGNQLAGKKRQKGWDRIQANYIYPAVAQTMAIISQRSPKIIALPQESGDKPGAEMWGAILQWQFNDILRMRRKLRQFALDGAVFGCYIAKTTWDYTARWDGREKKWIQQPRVVCIHPQFFGADPDCEEIEDAAFIVCKRRVPINNVIQRWPKFKTQIELYAKQDSTREQWASSARIAHRMSGEKDSAEPGDIEGRLVSIINRKFSDEAVGKSRDTAQYITIEEIFWKDESSKNTQDKEDVPYSELEAQGLITQDEGGQWIDQKGLPFSERTQRMVREFDEPTYPFGRYAIRIGEGNKKIILNDKEDKQVWPYVNWPYTVGINSLLPHIWQGMNQVELARGSQDWMNISMANMANYVRQFANPVTLVEQGALQGDPDNKSIASKLASAAGAIWKLARGGIKRVKREAPVQYSQGVEQFYRLMGEQIRDILGMQNVAMGKQSGGRPTATEMELLATSSQQAASLKSILLDDFTTQVMRVVLELDQNQMSPGEQMRITGRKAEEGPAKVSQKMLDEYYDLKLDISHARPFDREKTQQEALTLFSALGDYSPAFLPNLLDAFEVPNKDAVLAEVKAMQEAQQGVPQ